MINAPALKRLKNLLAPEDILLSPEDRACYAFDATGRNRIPDAVVFPRNTEAVSEIMRIADGHRIPVVPRGAGSGLSGGSVPQSGGLVMGMNRFDRIIEIDTENLVAVVEPCVVTAELHKSVERLGLFYPPDPASMGHATIGGNIAENAGGMRAVKYGVTKEYVMGLEVVLPNGDIVHTGSKCVKDVVGYNLTPLFVGSEGTLGIVTRAILKLLPLPEAKMTLMATFPTLGDAARTVSAVIRNRIIPVTMEFLDRHAIGAVEAYLKRGLPTQAGALLLIEVDGEKDQLDRQIDRVKSVCEENNMMDVQIAREKAAQDELWKARRSVSASMVRLKPRRINEDISVPRSRIPEMIAQTEIISEKHGVLIVNFGHAGDGNIHVNLLFGDRSGDDERVRGAVKDVFEAAIGLGGRISGEHGIGLAKRDYIGWNLDAPTLGMMRRVKRMFDPNNILNPGKIFP